MDTLEAQSKRAAMILHAAFDDIERAGIDATAVSLALITMGAEGLTSAHGAAFAAERLRRHADTVELYAAVTQGEG